MNVGKLVGGKVAGNSVGHVEQVRKGIRKESAGQGVVPT